MAAEAVDKNAKDDTRRSIVVVLIAIPDIVLAEDCCCWWRFGMCWNRAVGRVHCPAVEREGFIIGREYEKVKVKEEEGKEDKDGRE